MWLKGNQYYLLRTRNGREKKYSPNKLLEAFNNYVEWCIKNPFKEQQLFHYQGKVVKGNATKMRPFTLEGFCNFADICVNTFKNYEKLEISEDMSASQLRKTNDYLTVTSRIRQIIENQQFEGAAAGFLNHNIIARKLGLIHKLQHSGDKENPVHMVNRDVIIQEYNGE